jgi:CBS domain-containing protein
MKVTDVMQRKVEVISDNTSVREAARRMSEAGIGALPVIEDGKIAGMVTDRDLVVRSLARGDDPDKARAGEVMTRGVACVSEDDTLDDVSREMSECQVQRLLVLGPAGGLVGIVSLGDLSRALGSSPAATRALEDIKAPPREPAAQPPAGGT